ncbi:MAG TPA: MFS transporter [Burkholderiales bacterium]|jgi:MFS family permease|nr:MFS transporter [Burkholderiales bacterium]
MPFPAALRHRNYRLYFVGQGLSVLGTWMQRVAMYWLVYRLSGSELLLGLSGFMSQIPVLVLGPLGGLWADRVDRRRLLMVTQALAMVQASLLAYLTLRGHVAVWHVLVMSGLLGIINAIDTPLRQSFVVDIVTDRKDLPNAIAMNSLTNNSGRLIGPSIAGVMVSVMSEGACFAFNAFSYLAVLCALYMMRIAERPRARDHGNIREGLKAGAVYAWTTWPIRRLLLLLACVSFMATPYTVMMPVFADRVLKGGPHTMGYMLSAAGVGAVIGTIYLAWRAAVRGMDTLIGASAVAAGVALAIFAFSPWLYLSGAMMAVVGFGIIVTGAAINTMVQTIVHDAMRGRVMSFYTVAFLGVAPLGAITIGALAEATSVQWALAAGGVACAAAGVHFLRGREQLRTALRVMTDRDVG